MKNVMILAAGKGSRLKSKRVKIFHEILGKPVIEYITDLAKEVGSENTIVILSEGFEKELQVSDVTIAFQKEQKGTADALNSGIPSVKDGSLLVLCGDTPCITAQTIRALYEEHEKERNQMTVMSFHAKDPNGYGRIVRDHNGIRIVEQKDANEEQKRLTEVNSGVYLFDVSALRSLKEKPKADNAQNEYYLTDYLTLFANEGFKVGCFLAEDEEEMLGINTRMQLAQATKILQRRINEYWMSEGVSMVDPQSVYIDADVKLSKDVLIEPWTKIQGKSVIHEDVVIGPSSVVKNCVVKEGASVEQSTILDSTIGENTKVGPFGYVRPGSTIGMNCKIGDFVEVKNATIGNNTKISHLSYVGDADLGDHINIGCGVVFVNYDGKKKYRTRVEDNSFIGCNVNLISPVTVKEGAYVAAGTTVTKDVSERALSIGRVRATEKKDWYESDPRFKEK